MKGIYKITNTINNKVYIGESLNIETRWQEHIESLNNNTHHSYKLQEDWNTYGKENFKFEILEESDLENKHKEIIQKIINIYLESKYIKQYNSLNAGYNVENTLELILKGEKDIFGKEYKNSYRKEIGIKIFKNVIKNLIKNNGIYVPKEKPKSRPKIKKEPKPKKPKKPKLIIDENTLFKTTTLNDILNECKKYKFKEEFLKLNDVLIANGFNNTKLIKF